MARNVIYGTFNGAQRNSKASDPQGTNETLIVPIDRYSGTKNGLYRRYGVADTGRMKRPSVYPYAVTEPPGCNIHRLRNDAGLSQRELADRCIPPVSHTAIRRLEHNQGFTQDTIERVAKALGTTVPELFYPPEVAGWLKEYKELPPEARERIAEMVHDTYAAHKYRKRQTG